MAGIREPAADQGVLEMKTDQPARIVLMEDNPADVQVMRYALDAQDFQYQLEVLEDGEHALRFVREMGGQAEPSPCVLVLDLHLPKYDGFAILRAMRQEPAWSDVRVVAVTGVVFPAEEAKVLSFGVRLYREKPTDLAGVLKLGEEIIAVCKEQVLVAA
jgi:CheY-like chemotaxis protein